MGRTFYFQHYHNYYAVVQKPSDIIAKKGVVLRVEKPNHAISYEECNTATSHLHKQYEQSEGLFMGGACESQDKVYNCEIVDANFVLFVAHSGFHGDQSEHAQ